jgi:hypothetical protein
LGDNRFSLEASAIAFKTLLLYTVTTLFYYSPSYMADVKTEQLGLRITPTAKALLREAAAREHRSASNMVEHLILEYCEKNNIVVGVHNPTTETGKTTS